LHDIARHVVERLAAWRESVAPQACDFGRCGAAGGQNNRRNYERACQKALVRNSSERHTVANGINLLRSPTAARGYFHGLIRPITILPRG
jgi:hypothetical protein